MIEIRLQGGPNDGVVMEVPELPQAVETGHPTDRYVPDATDPALYIWTEGARPQPTADEPSSQTPISDGVRTHLQHLRDYLVKDPAQITNAESVHVIKDLIRAVHYLNSRFETEG